MASYGNIPEFPFSAVNQAAAYQITLSRCQRAKIESSFLGQHTGCGLLLHERTALSATPIQTFTHELVPSDGSSWGEHADDTSRELWLSAWTFHGSGPGTIGAPGWYQVPPTASLQFNSVYGGEVHYSAVGSADGPTTINVIIKLRDASAGG